MSDTIIRDPNSGRGAGVDENYNLKVRAVTGGHAAEISHNKGLTYRAEALDAGPTAAEYTFYLLNSSAWDYVIDDIMLYSVDADMQLIWTTVTGTAGGAAVITPKNLNLGSGNAFDGICRGGAGGVTGLTPVLTIATIQGGIANTNAIIPVNGRVILPKNVAFAFEYNAGTGGACSIAVAGHYHTF